MSSGMLNMGKIQEVEVPLHITRSIKWRMTECIALTVQSDDGVLFVKLYIYTKDGEMI